MPSRKRAVPAAVVGPSPAKGNTRAPRGDHTPEQISPSEIRPNEKNPRIAFPQGRIEALAQSLEEVGMLVPLTVYRDPGETEYVLLDGERRLRAAKLINMDTVPAWVTPKPEGIHNTLRMFNIHLMRDEWGEMATALALKEVIEDTGIDSDEELKKLTGLSPDRIKNMRRVLSFPEKWQQRVLDEEVPFNLLVELDKAILSKKRNPKTENVIPMSERQLRSLFLKKYDDGHFRDVVDLRKVGALIDTAASQSLHERVRRRAKQALEDLLDSKITIAEAYQYGAAASIEVKATLRELDILPDRLTDLTSLDLDDDDQRRLLAALRRLSDKLDQVLAGLGNASPRRRR